MKMQSVFVALLTAASLVACSGGDGDSSGALVAPAEINVPANSTVAGALKDVQFDFPAGVPSFGTTGTTSLTFTGTGTSPAFRINAGSAVVTGTTDFGSCIFRVSGSTQAPPLNNGAVITVNPCEANVRTERQAATGVAATRQAALRLGNAASTNKPVSVAVSTTGQLVVNGANVGTITLTPVTGL